jgi:hypothetical protein
MRQYQGIGRIPLTDPKIQVVEGAGFRPNQNLPRTDRRCRKILIRKLVRATMFTKDDSFHSSPSFKRSAFSEPLSSRRMIKTVFQQGRREHGD